MNKFKSTKFPKKIHITKYKQLQGPTLRIALNIIVYQFSIVIIWKTVTQAQKKLSKCCLGCPSGKSNFPPKIYIPNKAKIIIKSNNKREI